MRLADYSNLIKNLPYSEHSFETSKETWSAFKNQDAFSNIYTRTFKEPTIKLSRNDLFTCCNQCKEDAVFLIVFWGYPLGYTRPNTMMSLFPKFLKSIPELNSHLHFKADIDYNDFKTIINSISGIGLSTFTKFLYFFRMTINGERAVILDTRIIRALNSDNGFEELAILKGISESNKHSKYLLYLKVLNELACKYGFETDQLELFLFMFGNNLKAL